MGGERRDGRSFRGDENKAHAKGKKVKFRNWNLETGRYVRSTRGRGGYAGWQAEGRRQSRQGGQSRQGAGRYGHEACNKKSALGPGPDMGVRHKQWWQPPDTRYLAVSLASWV